MVFILFMTITPLNSQAQPQEDGVLRFNDGTVRMMNWPDAMKSCPKGTHLPTLREWANFAVDHGAHGVFESDLNDPGGNWKDALYTIQNIDSDGDSEWDSFYFFPEGYKPLKKGPLGKLEFWTSSGYPEAAPIYFNSASTFIWSTSNPRFFACAVRCVPNP